MSSLWILISAALCATVVYGSNQIYLGKIISHGKFGNTTAKKPLNPMDEKASTNARIRLEKLRQFFPLGFGGIPVLDPYKVAKPVSTVINDHEIQGVIDYNDFNLKGLGSFVLRKIEINLDSRRLDFELTFPKLQADVHYISNLKVDAAQNMLSGQFNSSLKDVSVKGVYSFASTWKNHLTIVGLEYNLFARHVWYNHKDLLRSRRSTPSKVTKMIVDELVKAAADSAAETIVKELNIVLTLFTERQILKLLLPDPDR